MSETAKELAFEHLKSQSQFAYFQLGLAASAIAFAVHETEGRSLSETPWPLGVAVILWAASFAAGCFGVRAHQRGIGTNARYLFVTAGSEQFQPDAELRQMLETAKEIVQSDMNRPGKRFQIQLWMLFIGALFYVAGHVMQMAAVHPAAYHVTPPQL